MVAELCAFAESGLNEFGGELLFSGDTDFLTHVALRVRHKHNVPQGQLASNAPQPPKALRIRPPPTSIRDPVKDPSTTATL